MLNFIVKRAAQSCVALGLVGTMCTAQSFDEGSFGDGSNVTTAPAPAQTQPAPSSGGGSVGGFNEGSFEPGGTGGTPSDVAPVPDGSGGGTGGEVAGIVGGDNFPTGIVLPDTPQSDVVKPVPQPNPQPTPTPGPNSGGVDPQIIAFETRDFGVPPQNSLRQGQFHAPTPTAVPGGNLLTTDGLVQAMNNGTQMVVIDVLGGPYGLPNAFSAPALAQAGSYNDRTQQQANSWLHQITGGNQNLPIVIYCSDPMCWLSYNASLRAIAAGYQQVYWYRGGLQAWQMVGLPMQPTGF
ncbi:MAG: rhodanese-like domain-containing protein [Paracoccaceae bacterium]